MGNHEKPTKAELQERKGLTPLQEKVYTFSLRISDVLQEHHENFTKAQMQEWKNEFDKLQAEVAAQSKLPFKRRRGSFVLNKWYGGHHTNGQLLEELAKVLDHTADSVWGKGWYIVRDQAQKSEAKTTPIPTVLYQHKSPPPPPPPKRTAPPPPPLENKDKGSPKQRG